MEEFKFFSDIYSTDFTIYEPNYANLVEVIPELEKRRLFPKYFSAPLFIMWEITGRCPCNCLYCYNESPKQVPELSPKQAGRLAAEIAKLKPFSVCLTGGEPTLREDFFALAGFFRKHNIPVSTVTSGWTVNEETAEKIYRTFNYVQVSIDGPDAQTHDLIRGTKGSFDRAVRAVRLLKKNGLNRLSVAFSCTQYNKTLFPEMVDLCLKLGVDELRTQYLMMVGKAGKNKKIELSPEEYDEIKSYIEQKQHELQAQNSKLMLYWGNPVVHIVAGGLIGRVVILRITAEGHYAISPYLPFVMGNAKEHSLLEIWKKGMRTGWKIPQIQKNIKNISTIHDVYQLNQRLDTGYINVLTG